MIASQDQRQVFLININGEQFFFKKRATHKEVKLVRGNKKEVVVLYRGQRKTIAIPK